MTQLTKRNVRQNAIVVRHRRRAASRLRALRQARTGHGSGHLPRVWAVAARVEAHSLQRCSAKLLVQPPRPPELAFYRKYTQALLRRYMRLSLAAGRVPSLIGRELFRGNVTHYRAHGLEDVVIFCHDVEKRLAQLSPLDQQLVQRIGLQRYTHPETAMMLGLDLNRTVRRYQKVVDILTKLFLEAGLLEPQIWCQEG